MLNMEVFLVLLILGLVGVSPSCSSPNTRHFHFRVEWKEVSRLCHKKNLLTVNGKYPGPTIAVHEGDNLKIKVKNNVHRNTTIHWHGVKQYRTGWADGPAYITQCPISQGQSYTYKFSVNDQRGTLLWHAHYSWQRASVYGAFIIYPRMPYPFSPSIHKEIPIIFGEWWNGDPESVELEMMRSGGGPNVSDAYTINGYPGPLYPCSNKETFIQTVDPGKTYMLRIINAALNSELFFSISNHTLTVVEIDAVYTKPFKTKAIMIAPGQTTNVLITTNQVLEPSGIFVMAAQPYISSVFPFDNSITIGFLKYNLQENKKIKIPTKGHILIPRNLPRMRNNAFATWYGNRLKSLASDKYPCFVPRKIDKRVMITISLNLQDCPKNKPCKGIMGKRFLASMNNQSFYRPHLSILEGQYRKSKTKALSYDFPQNPPKKFNYTGVDALAENMNANIGTKLLSIAYGTRLEIVLQDTGFLNLENHPIHLHGYNFFIVGTGFGNYDMAKGRAHYNLVDPPERNTVAVPSGGWAAIRLIADNPGVWFMHCHIEAHTSWGLSAGLVVENGSGPLQRIKPPPRDLPSC